MEVIIVALAGRASSLLQTRWSRVGNVPDTRTVLDFTLNSVVLS